MGRVIKLAKHKGNNIYLTNNDVVLIKNGEIFNIVCCDCGLAHNMTITRKWPRRILYKAVRDNDFTAQTRRKQKFVCQPVS